MKQNKTVIAEVLDRSGSMEPIIKPTCDGHNEFLRGQKAVSGECDFLLVQFDYEDEVLYDGPIADAPELTELNFVPRGSTALLDCIGGTIKRLGARLDAMPEDERPEKVVFVILTDGEENSSVRYTRSQINDMITLQRTTYNWQFLFLGANQDAIQAGRDLGIAAQNSATYSVRNTRNTYHVASTKVASLRSSGIHGAAAMSTTMSFTDQERKELVEDEEEKKK